MANEGTIIRNLKLGTSRAALEAKPDSPLAQILKLQVQEIVDRLKDKINEYDLNASRDLSNSIQPSKKVVIKGNSITIPIEAEFYWKFLNYGVNGTDRSWGAPQWGSIPQPGLSFKDSIADWVAQKGVALPEQFSSFDQFHYAIMTNKRKHGQEPKPFYSDVVTDALTREMREPIEKLLGRAMEIVILEPFK